MATESIDTTTADPAGTPPAPAGPQGHGLRNTLSKVATYLLLTLLSLIILFPIYMLILRALSSPLRYIAAGQPLYPVDIQWDVFSNAFTQANLGRAMGLSFDVRLVLTDEMKLVNVSEQSIGEALLVAQENRTELKAQKNRERLASLTLSSVTNERVPSIKALADVGMIGNQIPNALTTDNVQVLMTVPIFDGGQREGRISESRSKVRQESIKT